MFLITNKRLCVSGGPGWGALGNKQRGGESDGIAAGIYSRQTGKEKENLRIRKKFIEVELTSVNTAFNNQKK